MSTRMSILQASNLMPLNTLVISAMGIVKISRALSLEMSVGDGSQDPSGLTTLTWLITMPSSTGPRGWSGRRQRILDHST